MADIPSRQQLEEAYCWDPEDEVPRRPDMTDFRRRLRYHQARWREEHGHPMGSQPIAPRPGEESRSVGSRLPLAYARQTGANFITRGALKTVQARASVIEPHQTVDHQRLWADLLWSPAIAFNLFGDLAVDLRLASKALREWFPDLRGSVAEVRFAHSPGRLDPTYINSLRAFDAAFMLDLGDDTRGIVALDVKYHERNKAETPRPENLWRYGEVAERSGIFKAGAIDRLKTRSDLAVMWLEHVLLLSMLQHGAGTWRWGRYVVVHPRGNTDIIDACGRYRALLADPSSFASLTLEDMLDSGAFAPSTVPALRERYVP